MNDAQLHIKEDIVSVVRNKALSAFAWIRLLHWHVPHFFSWLSKIIFESRWGKDCLAVLGIISLIVSIFYCLHLIWYQVVVVSGWLEFVHENLFIIQLIMLLLSLFWGGLFILIIASPLSYQERKGAMASSKLDETLSEVTTELTQMNLNVAALHVKVDGIPMNPIVDERWLRSLDERLNVRESLVSVEKVILARQRDVGDVSKSILQDRRRAGRAVTSSISGVSVGFFTYQLGGAVKNYLLMSGGLQHPPKLPDLACSAEDQSSGKCKISDNSVANPNYARLSHAELQQYDLNSKYYEPELMAEAILLTVTLMISIIAAWIGWLNAANE
jgi:hypothetical protein